MQPIEHIAEIEKTVNRFSEDEHVKAPDIFTKFEDLRYAVHDLRKVIEQEKDN